MCPSHRHLVQQGPAVLSCSLGHCHEDKALSCLLWLPSAYSWVSAESLLLGCSTKYLENQQAEGHCEGRWKVNQFPSPSPTGL